jgi:hypothetical protein
MKEDNKKKKKTSTKNTIPADVQNTIATLEAMKENNMTSPTDEIELMKFKKLYPTMFA